MGGKIITELREKLGLSQTELSEALGLAGPNVISRWETGRRVPNEAVRRLICYLHDLPSPEAGHCSKTEELRKRPLRMLMHMEQIGRQSNDGCKKTSPVKFRQYPEDCVRAHFFGNGGRR